MKEVKRREFLKNLSISILGTTLRPTSLDFPFEKTSKPIPKSKVAVVRDPEATQDDGIKVNSEKMHAMMNTAIKQITGQSKVSDAYASLFPKIEKNDIIAIKVNCMHTKAFADGCFIIIDSIVSGLKTIGVAENNLIIYDSSNKGLVESGYELNTGASGVRCFGNDEEGWGYDNATVRPGGETVHLSKILTRCNHLINIPVLRDHFATGISLSLKNHYGSVDSPSSLHGLNVRCDPHMAELNALDPIKKRTRLIVLPALVGVYEGHHSPPQFVYNGLIASQDPVAVDYIGYQIIEEQRVIHDLRPLAKTGRFPKFLETAAQLGLGTNDPNNIELITINEVKA